MPNQYLSQDEFIDIAKKLNYSPHAIRKHIRDTINPSYNHDLSKIADRIASYRNKGLLPLESGNKVDHGQSLRGVSTLYSDTGEIKQQWVKTDVPKTQSIEAFTSAIESLSSSLPTYTPGPPPVVATLNEDCMTIYPIGDAHIGMLAHIEESGQNNDLKLSEHRLTSAMALAVDQAYPTAEAFIIDVGGLIADLK